MRKLFFPIILFIFFTAHAQELEIEIKSGNTSNQINDGFIHLQVSGGEPPYTYKWSNPKTPLTSSRAEGLTEGIPYEVSVKDSRGASLTRSVKIKPKFITEHFNGSFVPLVNAMSSFLFWDPFSAMGIYDPKIYSDSKNVPLPGWEQRHKDSYVLKEWKVPEGEPVKEGELIAIVSSKQEGEIKIYANATGKLYHLTAEEDEIYDANNQTDVIEVGAHNLATIYYEEPVILTHPNGDPITHNIPFIVIWFIFGALFFTIKMGFINFRGFKHSLQLASGKFDDPDAPGKITHFQTMATAVSATVGLGNIAGVAIAISMGGAGATFWMIIAGLLGMASKFTECTLGLKYRTITPEGRIFGGPMNYLRYGLEKRNMKGLGKFLAALFALLCIGATLGGGNMFQANQSYVILAGQFSFLEGHGFWFGLALATLVGAVIIGGIESIGKVTGRIVPLMAAIYIIAAFTVIFVHIENIGMALTAIYEGAFTPSALKGGIIGVMIVGFQRAAFSSESGVGSAAIAHSAGKTKFPASEGYVALLEPFIDTVVICTLTALVLIFTGMHEVQGIGGVQLTSDAFASVISWFPYLLSLVVFLFAFSTMISWSYYGMRAWTYLFGKSEKIELIYKLIFLIFVIIGSSIGLGAVLSFSDMLILTMSFPNIIGLYIMSGEVKNDLKEYTRKLKTGELFKMQHAEKDSKAA